MNAIDGGESTIYHNTPIDIDNEGEVDSRKQTDFDGGGERGMGEGDYCGTPPGEVTFLDFFAVFAYFAVK